MRIRSIWILTVFVFFLAGCQVKFNDPRKPSTASTANETVQASTGPTLPPITSTQAPVSSQTAITPTPTVAPPSVNIYNLSGTSYSTTVTTCNDTSVTITFVPNMTNIVMDPTGWHGTYVILNGIIVFTPQALYGGQAGVSYNGTVNGQARHVEVGVNVGFCTITPPPQSTSTPSGGTAPVVTVVTITPQFITTPNNLKIPNFCDAVVASGTTTVTAIADGNWSSGSTWSNNQVPSAGQQVKIFGKTVIYDLPTPAVTTPATYNPALQTLCIESGGVLRFRTDMNTQLRVQNLVDLPGGTLEIGSTANPMHSNFKAEIIIADQPLDTNSDPEQFGNGLIVLGKVTMHGATLTETFVRLAVEPLAGDTTLTLSQPVTGWKVGDRLLLPDSKHLQWNDRAGNYVSQLERPFLSSVSSNGLILTLSAPLLYKHPGVHTTTANTSPIDSHNGIAFLPHVGNTTRNVVIRSQSATQVARGHSLFTERAEVDIQFVQFSGMGRSKNPHFAAIDNTIIGSNGNTTHVGTNQLGRYPVYFNHLYGPTPATSSSQYIFVGNSVLCPINPMPFLWGIAVNDSHFGLIKDNVLYNWSGAGLMVEGGNETGNVIAHNFVVLVMGTGVREDNYAPLYGISGSGYWVRGPLNLIRDNVATNMPSGAYGYGFNFNFGFLGNGRVPNAPGSSTALIGQYSVQNLNAKAVVEFKGCEAYGALGSGMTYWWWNTTFNTPNNGGVSAIQDLRVWNHFAWGIFAYMSNDVMLDGLVMRGDPVVTASNNGATGLYWGDYYQKNNIVSNADIRNMGTGIMPTDANDGVFTVRDSYLQNKVDIYITTQWRVGYTASWIQPRTVILSNVKFVALPNQSHKSIVMKAGENSNLNHIVSDRLFSYDHNQIPNNNFQLYYAEQDANFPLPPHRYYTDGTTIIEVGCPVAPPDPANCIFGGAKTGCMTNQECFNATGMTRAGEMLPATNYYTDPEIHGLKVDR